MKNMKTKKSYLTGSSIYSLTSFMFSFNTKFNENPITTAFVRGVFPQNTNFI